jgi:hypothetical protein
VTDRPGHSVEERERSLCSSAEENGSRAVTVAAGSEFCVQHTKLLASVDAETMKRRKAPKQRTEKAQLLRVVAKPPYREVAAVSGPVATADPSAVRPSLALAAPLHERD